jgi:hypothetical protein
MSSLAISQITKKDIGKSIRQDSRHQNDDTTNQENKDVIKAVTVQVLEASVKDDNLEYEG